MNLDTYAIMCAISVHAIAEAKRPASFLKQEAYGLRFAYLTETAFAYLQIQYCHSN